MRKREWIKKLLSLTLCAVMVLGMLPTAIAGTPLIYADPETVNEQVVPAKVADPATLNTWKDFFPTTGNITTQNAGGVWSDKSVFAGKTVTTTGEDGSAQSTYITPAAEYLAKTDEVETFSIPMKDAENNFLVSMSAIASTKSIKGYSSIPTDTILVLDMSSSMNTAGSIDELADAANKAVEKLLSANHNNRVGVVLYSGNDDSMILLPLDRYDSSVTNGDNKYLDHYVETYGDKDSKNDRMGIKVVNGVTAGGSKVSAQDTYHSGTFTQDGVYLAMKQLLAADKVVTSGIQAGEERMPIIVLMTDGEPTLLSNDFTGSNEVTHRDGVAHLKADGGVATGTTKDFMTQLQAGYAKYMLEEGPEGKRYNTHDLLFYTLGLGNVSDLPALLPQDSDVTDTLWTDFLKDWKVRGNDSMNLDWSGYMGNAANADEDVFKFLTAMKADPNRKTNKYRAYVNRYFAAGSADALESAFQAIVNEIILQSMYFPTFIADGSDHHHDGYLEFKDVIGDYMEVKDIKGIQIGEKLYTGAAYTAAMKNGEMGTKENPSSYGDNLVWSIIERLNVQDRTVDGTYMTAKAQVWDLLKKAWDSGQLSYSSDTSYSNYVGWYGVKDSNNNIVYQQWWDGKTIDKTLNDASGAETYAVQSFGFRGDVTQGLRSADMYYISVQIRTNIDTGVSEVIFRIPASLIPLVEYEVELEGDTLSSNMKSLHAAGAKAPIRLLFEVGLREDINSLNVNSIVPADYPYRNPSNGDISFYTNHWTTEGENHVDAAAAANNTSVWFEPSKENERYYYHEDSTIYTDNNGTKYSGAAPTGGTLYTRRYVYETGKAAPTAVYDVIPVGSDNNALTYAQQASDGSWYIKEGTPRMSDSTIRLPQRKAVNMTGTRGGYEHPVVKYSADHKEYHLAAVLGNNGKLRIKQATGIKITKTIEGVEINDQILTPGENEVYTFTIRSTGTPLTAGAVYKTYLEGNDDLIDPTDAVVGEDGVITVQLKKNQTIYVAGLPAGTYTVTEAAGNDYMVKSFVVNGTAAINGAAGNVTVEDQKMTAVDVVNTVKTHGAVSIGKRIDQISHDNHRGLEFTFDVTVALPEGKTGTTFPIIHSAKGAGTLIVDDDGKAASYTYGAAGSETTEEKLKLKHDETVQIQALPEGAVVTVTETDIPQGFSVKPTQEDAPAVNTESVTIVAGQTADIDFVNTYKPEKSDAPTNVMLQIEKILDGYQYWHGGTFEFVLEAHRDDGNGHIDHVPYTKTVTITYTGEETTGIRTADAISLADFGVQPYTEAGVYSYRIYERSGAENGMLYDGSYAYFDVHVTDNGNGKLVISDVTAATDTMVEPIMDKSDPDKQIGWLVKADFYNNYSIAGAASMLLNIEKSVVSASHASYSPAGFTFGLYEADETYVIKNGAEPLQTVITNAAGVATIRETYTAQDLLSGGTKYYVLREEIPGQRYITAAPQDYKIKIQLSNNAGQLQITKTVLHPDGSITTDTETTRKPTVSFELVSDGSGNAVQILAISETAGQEIWYRVNKSESEYTGIIPVSAPVMIYAWTQTGEGESIQKSDEVAAYYDGKVLTTTAVVRISVTAGFTNTYNPAPATLTLSGTKTLIGRDWTDEENYQFELYTADSSYQVGTLLQTAAAPADTNPATWNVTASQFMPEPSSVMAADDDSSGIAPLASEAKPFTFAALSFNQVGTYYFVVREKIPADADKAAGVTYDGGEFRIEVRVVDDGAGQLHAFTTIVDENNAVNPFDFTNTYTPAPIPAAIAVEKTLRYTNTGELLPFSEGVFSFELYHADNRDDTIVKGDKVELGGTAAAGAAAPENGYTGRTAFTQTYDIGDVGDHYYIVKEVLPEGADPATGSYNGGTYDLAEHVVKVTVSYDQTTGKLSAVTDYGSENASAVQVRNSYTSSTEDQVELKVSKTLEDPAFDEAKPQTFWFDLYQTNVDFALAENAEPLQSQSVTISSKNVLTGQASFSALSYNKPGTYCYVLKERAEAENILMQYSATVYHIRVTVTDNGRGDLIVSKTIAIKDLSTEEEPGLAFTNVRIRPADVTVELDVAKTVKGASHEKSGFEFVLTETDSEFVPLAGATPKSVISDANGAAGFDLTFTEDDIGKTFYYTVSEVEGGKTSMTYDKTVYRVAVGISFNEQTKELEADIISDPAGTAERNRLELAFTNKYDPEPVNVTIIGSKILENKALSGNDYVFELYKASFDQVDGMAVTGDAIAVSKNDSTGTFCFSGIQELTFSDIATAYFAVKEQIPADRDSKVTYDTAVHYVKVTVASSGTGQLVTSTTMVNQDGTDTTTPLTFTNTYTPDPAGIVLGGVKTMTGRAIAETESFEFVLYEADGTTEIDREFSQHDASHHFYFEELHYDVNDAGKTFHYVIKEALPAGAAAENGYTVNGITYDTSEINVAVEVRYDNGTLTTSAVYSDNTKDAGSVTDKAVFVNQYSAKPVSGVALNGVKKLENAILSESQFSFTLSEAVMENGALVKKSADAKSPVTVQNDREGKFAFAAIDPEKHDEMLDFTAVGTYYFVVEEVLPDGKTEKDGIHYDTAKIYYRIDVTDDGKGALVASAPRAVDASGTPVADGKLEFTNTYRTKPVTEKTIVFTKSLEGRDLKDQEFSFHLYESDASGSINTSIAPLHGKNDADGKVSFTISGISTIGTKYYLVEEVIPEGARNNLEDPNTLDRVTYDPTRYLIKVVASDDGKGQLTAEYEITKLGVGTALEASELKFVNRYEEIPDPDPIQMELDIQKYLRNARKLDGFVFELVDAGGTVVTTAVSGQDGKAKITVPRELTYADAASGTTYSYVLREKDTGLRNMVYSQREYNVVISVGFDQENESLYAIVTRDGEVMTDENDVFAFTNVYRPPYTPPVTPGKPDEPTPVEPELPEKGEDNLPTSPDTGDEGNALWLAMIAAGILGFAVTAICAICRRRRIR